jgi:hypothetical protein
MGVCLGTLTWNSHQGDGEVDKRIKVQLRHNLKYYNLSEADVNFAPHYEEGKSSFSVEISGFSILWNGGKNNCDIIINKFLDESQQKYNELCHMEKTIQFLPM